MTSVAARYILITGAAGAGTTTLAAALARHLRCPHIEADDFLWLPSQPPYLHLADRAQRGERLLNAMTAAGRAVVAGSVTGWGQSLEDTFDHVVFLYLPTDLRLERLERREIERFGHAKPEFLDWAASYDNGTAAGRSLERHLQWLSERACPVLKLEGDMPTADRLQRVLGALCDPEIP